MMRVKITISLDHDLLVRLDRMVRDKRLPSRSRFVEQAIRDKVKRHKMSRLARECAKVDVASEHGLAEEVLREDFKRWPEY